MAKHVIRPEVGPLGMTVKSSDNETIDEYFTAKRGFVNKIVDGRLWFFRVGSEDIAEFVEVGEPAKYVTRPAAGPMGMTIKSPDTETILSYMAAQNGFTTVIQSGRIWVFRPGSPALKEFRNIGEPLKYVIRPGAGPMGMTVNSPDTETFDAYLRVAMRQGE